MADLIRAVDWSSTALGPIESWPDTLVTTVNMLLAALHPMFLWWGPELIQFYNDGYRLSIRADKHPSAVGQRGPECWPEIWPIIGPQIESVMTEGRSTWHTNQLVPLNRDGRLEEVYWTYSYSPVRDKAGAVRGALVVCSETTEQVLAERRLKTVLAVTASEQSAAQLTRNQTLVPFVREIISTLRCNAADIPFAALYRVNGSDVECLGATSPISDPKAVPFPLEELLRSNKHGIVDDISRFTGELFHKIQPGIATRAYVLPLPLPAHGTFASAVFVFGLSPLLPFDERYETFLQLIGGKISELLHSELQRLELLQAAVRFRALAQANPFGMLLGSLNGELKYVNPVFLKTLGYTEDDVASGRVRWDSLTPPECVSADARAVEQLHTTGRCDVYETIYIAKDGRRIPILIGASVIDTPEASAEVAAFVTELTPLKTAEEALRTANDELEKKVAQRTAALKTEIAERKRMEINLRELTGRLLRAQDEERRHMARELHDNAGQTLAALSMNLSAIQSVSGTGAGNENAKLKSLASEAKQLSDDLSREIRTLSYLLHPPLLDEIGLESAIRWYVDGFSQRSQITVDLDLPGDAERLPRELELVLFRVVQESLTNVHRHSGSSSATIHLKRSDQHVELDISDRGIGISTKMQRNLTGPRAGVGVRGMEERVRQFGGTLQITSSPEGTKVMASLPFKPNPG